MSPTEAITVLVAIIRNREFSTRYLEAIKAIMALIEYGFTVLGSKTAFAAGPEPTDAELQECGEALASFQDEGQTFGAVGDAEMNPLLVAALVKLALQVISALLARKK